MALIVDGKSKCALCNELILSGDSIELVPAGCFSMPSDPHHRLSDAGMHSACLDAQPDAAGVRESIRQFIEAKELGANERQRRLRQEGPV